MVMSLSSLFKKLLIPKSVWHAFFVSSLSVFSSMYFFSSIEIVVSIWGESDTPIHQNIHQTTTAAPEWRDTCHNIGSFIMYMCACVCACVCVWVRVHVWVNVIFPVLSAWWLLFIYIYNNIYIYIYIYNLWWLSYGWVMVQFAQGRDATCSICLLLIYACNEENAYFYNRRVRQTNMERDPTRCYHSILPASLDTHVAVAMYRFFHKICILFCFAVLWVIPMDWFLWCNNPHFYGCYAWCPVGKIGQGWGIPSAPIF